VLLSDDMYDHKKVKLDMAFYLVRAKPKKEGLETLSKRNSLKEELNSGKISRMRPFGQALQYSRLLIAAQKSSALCPWRKVLSTVFTAISFFACNC
jgi:hypothetical protein